MTQDKSVCHFRCISLLIIYMITWRCRQNETRSEIAMEWRNLKPNGISY